MDKRLIKFVIVLESKGDNWNDDSFNCLSENSGCAYQMKNNLLNVSNRR